MAEKRVESVPSTTKHFSTITSPASSNTESGGGDTEPGIKESTNNSMAKTDGGDEVNDATPTTDSAVDATASSQSISEPARKPVMKVKPVRKAEPVTKPAKKVETR